MAAQVSASMSGDSLLYSFMPGVSGKGGSAVASPPPLPGPRRQRNHSLSGELANKQEDKSEPSQDLLVSPRSLSSLPTSGRTSTNGGGSSTRGGSADRHHHQSLSNGSSGGSAMPVILGSIDRTSAAGAAIGGAGVNVRQSLNGSAVGLPKLDLPTLYGSGAAAAGELPGLAAMAGRRSVNGASCDLSSSLDGLPMYGSYDCSAPPSPTRQGAPTVLAPLRGAFGSPTPSTAMPVNLAANGAAATDAPTTWCVGSVGGGPSTLGRAYSGSRRVDAAGSPLTSYESSPVATPLTPSAPAACLPGGPLGRSHSFTSKRSGSGGGITGGRLSIDFADGAGADGLTSPTAESDHGDPNGTAAGTASRMLSEVNEDLQRACGALLALHAPPSGRAGPGSAAARPSGMAAAAATGLTAQQVAALRDSAPELHSEVRNAVRRAFQVMRQAVGAPSLGGGGSEGGAGGPAAPLAAPAPALTGERRLGQCMHQCWATLDALLEGTADLTSMMVGEVLSSRPGGSSLAMQPSPPSQPSARHQQPQQPSTGAADVRGEVRASSRASGPTQPVPEGSLHESERLRATNQDLQRQLEECRGLLAKAEARAVAAEAATPPRPTTGAGPRPPGGPAAAPPLDRCASTSPRRGKLARAHLLRDDAAGAPDGVEGDGVGGVEGAGATTAGCGPASSCEASAELPRRFDRAAVLARGPSYGELVIEEDDSEDDLDDAANPDVRRAMLNIRSASFAEWVRGGGTRRR